MHQDFTYTDLADRYLKGKLSESERLAFEEKIQQDPLLASEMSLQRDIYRALGETRRMALKHRLDQVPVHSSPGAAWRGLRVAAAVGTLLLVGATYYHFGASPESAPSVISSLPTVQSTAPQEISSMPPAPAELIPEVTVSAVAEETSQPVATSVRSSSVRAPLRSRTTPTIVRPKVVSEFDESSPSVSYHDFDVPEKQALQNSTYQEEDVAIEAMPDSDHSFHYQFYDNKLYLHGDFSGRPYKIIALNTETDKKLFLEFDRAYYRIGKRQEITPLVRIEDHTLIRSLKDLGRVD